VVPKPVVAAADVPRTAKPAEVVAVSVASKGTRGRRAQRRAAKLAEKVAAEEAALAARQARLRRRSEKAMGVGEELGDAEQELNKREKEHVDWVQHLISLPNDPTLTTRNK
jgi:hypothetical protein